MTSVLITGSEGRIGRELQRHWADRPLICLDRHDCDLGVHGEWSRRFAGVDTVVHLAGDPNPEADFASGARSNVSILLNVITAALEGGVKRFVYASSVWTERQRFGLSSSKTYYAASKLCGESLVKALGESEGIVAVCLRLGLFDPELKETPPRMDKIRLSTADLCRFFDEAIAGQAPGYTKLAIPNPPPSF